MSKRGTKLRQTVTAERSRTKPEPVNTIVCQRCFKGIRLDESMKEESVFSSRTTRVGRSALTSSGGETPGSPHTLLQTLMEMASDTTQCDHPLCAECSSLHLFELNKQLTELDNEYEQYQRLAETLDVNLNSELEREVAEVHSIKFILIMRFLIFLLHLARGNGRGVEKNSQQINKGTKRN